MEFMECLNVNLKKKGYFLYIRCRAALIATDVNLLDTKYKFYRLNGDLRGTIN